MAKRKSKRKDMSIISRIFSCMSQNKEIRILTKKTIELSKENDYLKLKVAILECQPYRGPEFFKALDEEKKSGLLL